MPEISIEDIMAMLTALATIALVILLWRTLKQFKSTADLSRLQSEYRFRPWIGPSNSIKYLKTQDGTYQFDIGIKNFGEIPASNVVAMYSMKNELIDKNNAMTNPEQKFDLGPLLPNMEKHYWFFIDSELIKKSQDGSTKIFISLYFEYNAMGKKSGYGMISEYLPKTNSFMHKEMWVEDPSSLLR